SSGGLLPPFDLAANTAHRVDHLMYCRNLHADGLEQIKLLLQILLRGGDAWVFANLERLCIALFPQFELNLIDSWGHLRAFHDLLGFLVAFNSGRIGVAHIPDETIGPRRFGDTRLLLLFLFAFALVAIHMRLPLLLFTGEGFDDVARGIKEGQGKFLLWLLSQKVMNNHPIGRVLASIEVSLDLLAGRGLLLAIDDMERAEVGKIFAGGRRRAITKRSQEARGRSRLKEMDAGLAYLIVHLTQGRDVIKYPERAPMRRNEQIVTFDDEIVNRHNRQIQAQALPVYSVIE